MKKCSKCGEIKSFSDFHKQASSSDGHAGYCKSCSRQYHKNWVQNNPERVKETRLAYERDHYDRIQNSTTNWRKNNLERHKTNKKKWNQANAARTVEMVQRRRARKKSNGVYLISDKFLQKLYSSPCAICGSSEKIEADHIIPILRGGVHSEANLQPLCRSCNGSKGTKTMTEWRAKKSEK